MACCWAHRHAPPRPAAGLREVRRRPRGPPARGRRCRAPRRRRPAGPRAPHPWWPGPASRPSPSRGPAARRSRAGRLSAGPAARPAPGLRPGRWPPPPGVLGLRLLGGDIWRRRRRGASAGPAAAPTPPAGPAPPRRPRSGSGTSLRPASGDDRQRPEHPEARQPRPQRLHGLPSFIHRSRIPEERRRGPAPTTSGTTRPPHREDLHPDYGDAIATLEGGDGDRDPHPPGPAPVDPTDLDCTTVDI